LSGGLGDLESYPGAQHEASGEGNAGEEGEAGFQSFEQLLGGVGKECDEGVEG
jgi:hypothetical protein